MSKQQNEPLSAHYISKVIKSSCVELVNIYPELAADLLSQYIYRTPIYNALNELEYIQRAIKDKKDELKRNNVLNES